MDTNEHGFQLNTFCFRAFEILENARLTRSTKASTTLKGSGANIAVAENCLSARQKGYEAREDN
jgi:hypothetical protein